jgi:hypothetical protein
VTCPPRDGKSAITDNRSSPSMNISPRLEWEKEGKKEEKREEKEGKEKKREEKKGGGEQEGKTQK